LRAIGVASYSIYLWQQLFLDPGKAGFMNVFPQNVILALSTGFASYRLIEAPFLSLKTLLARPPASRRTARPRTHPHAVRETDPAAPLQEFGAPSAAALRSGSGADGPPEGEGLQGSPLLLTAQRPRAGTAILNPSQDSL